MAPIRRYSWLSLFIISQFIHVFPSLSNQGYDIENYNRERKSIVPHPLINLNPEYFTAREIPVPEEVAATNHEHPAV